MDLVDKIIAFEQGELTDDQILEFFQDMVDDGSVWHLQGSYGRMAQALIDQGFITPAPEDNGG